MSPTAVSLRKRNNDGTQEPVSKRTKRAAQPSAAAKAADAKVTSRPGSVSGTNKATKPAPSGSKAAAKPAPAGSKKKTAQPEPAGPAAAAAKPRAKPKKVDESTQQKHDRLEKTMPKDLPFLALPELRNLQQQIDSKIQEVNNLVKAKEKLAKDAEALAARLVKQQEAGRASERDVKDAVKQQEILVKDKQKELEAAQKELGKLEEQHEKELRKKLEALWADKGLKVNMEEEPSFSKTIQSWRRKYWNMFQAAQVTEETRVEGILEGRRLEAEQGKQGKEAEEGGEGVDEEVDQPPKSKKQKKSAGEKIPSRRPDRVAQNQMKEQEWQGKALWAAKEKCFGYVPGIKANETFYNRAEMSVVGLHNPPLAGIDFMTEQETYRMTKGAVEYPVAISIVVAGNYQDDSDDGESLIYTGQGGNDLLGKKNQVKDQIFDAGNLALAGNVATGIPVRVSRKNNDDNSPYGVVFTFDGLYRVVRWWAEPGKEGFKVYKYLLRRIRGQPNLLSKNVDFGGVQSVPPQITPQTRTGIMCLDYSKGQEKIPVVVVNDFDQELPPGIDPNDPEDQKFMPIPDKDKPQKFVKSSAPYNFRYITQLEYANNVPRPQVQLPASRKPGESDEDWGKRLHAAIQGKNIGGLPYHYNGRMDGDVPLEPPSKLRGKVTSKYTRLKEMPHPLVVECGAWCGCPHGNACVQAPSAQGLRFRLEIFKTGNGTGWGVRSWDTIPSGTVVVLFLGKVHRSEEGHTLDPEYHFDMEPRPPPSAVDYEEEEDLEALETEEEEGSSCKYFVDGREVGNVARFINHGCEPNLYVQPVCSGHQDSDHPLIALVAYDNIKPLTELKYDYGMAYWRNQLKRECKCGAPKCRTARLEQLRELHASGQLPPRASPKPQSSQKAASPGSQSKAGTKAAGSKQRAASSSHDGAGEWEGGSKQGSGESLAEARSKRAAARRR